MAFTRVALAVLVLAGAAIAQEELEDVDFDGAVKFKYVVNEEEHTRESYTDLMKNYDPNAGLWPMGDDGIVKIYYKYTGDGVDKNFMNEAFKQWSSDTCLKFEEMSPSDTRTNTYLGIHMGTWCLSYVGSFNDKHTDVSMYAACGLNGYIHELGHALGLHHEQCRSDRDEYITVKYSNIKDKDYGSFKKMNTNNFDVDFDYMSNMLYPPFSNSKNGRQTMIPTNILWGGSFGYPTHTTYMNRKIINRALHCDKAFLKKCKLTEDPCQNGGYMGGECKCLCPLGTKGDKCEDFQMSYNDAMLHERSPLSKYIETPGVISSPNYPDTPRNKFSYIQVLVAPECHRVVLTFTEDSDMLYRSDGKCEWDRLSISSELDDPDTKDFCKDEIKKGMVVKSKKHQMLVQFKFYGWAHKGFKGTWNYEPIPGCTESDY